MYALALIVIAQVAPNDTTDKDLNAEKVFAAHPPESPDGWTKSLSVGANGALTRSTNVVGTVNGTTAQAGIIVEGSATLKHGLNSWENGLKLNESFTRTPVIAHFVKSADELRLQSTYLHRLEAVEWLGPYVRFLGTTSIFRGWNVSGTDITVSRTLADGTVIESQKLAGEKYGLTKPFEPLVLRESAGFFANPLTGSELAIKTRLGGALQEILTQHGFALSDDSSTTDIIEYKQLVDSTQGGAELDIEAVGSVVTNVTYNAKAGFFYPFVETNGDQVKGSKLQTDISAKLSVHLSKFLSLDYVLSAKRIPLIVEEWQVQNGLLLTAAFTVI